MNLNDNFKPPLYLRSPLLQSMLNSSSLRNRGRQRVLECEEEVIIDAGSGVRLQGFLSRHGDRAAKGRVIILHGWEGSARSAYVVHTGEYFFSHGYEVFRLNFRDHGATHHLNEGLFFGTLIDEVFTAVKHIAEKASCPSFLVGFSLGGSFAFRIAQRYAAEMADGLRHIVAINPPLDPLKCTRDIDRNFLFREYFLIKWRRSMKKKQAAFPALYDFRREMTMTTCMEITESLIRRYSGYADAADYFSRYTLTGAVLDGCAAPLAIIMAEDDPIVSAGDFRTLRTSGRTRLILHRYGGHCGYIQNIRMQSWYQEALRVLFDAAVSGR